LGSLRIGISQVVEQNTMKLIVVNSKHNRSRHLSIGMWSSFVLSACFLGVPAGAGFVVGQYLSEGEQSELLNAETIQAWQSKVAEQRRQMDELAEQEGLNQHAVEVQLAAMQSQLLRIDALGERLTDIAGIDGDEFDFSQAPALGGPLSTPNNDHDYAPNVDFLVEDEVANFSALLSHRSDQLNVLESLLLNENQQRETRLAGRPITSGWLSSRFGYRTDPFTGRRAWHNGVDFAGAEGADVISVAAGVVTWSGSRHGYGNLIEINHGNGLVTRYGHNKDLKVQAGDVVRRGDVISSMGSTGRSTGPHVHFEVYKHGRAVDPASYVNRTHR
jgi:murein DD-endopeptidase MepM/ murein hydrolase activator NlpD